MNLTEALTLTNFWNDLKAKYPEGLKIFTDWVDEYKKAVYWKGLFGAEIIRAPKFHELPYAFQLGIWLEFVNSMGGCAYDIDVFQFDLKEEITQYVANVLQTEANEKSK